MRIQFCLYLDCECECSQLFLSTKTIPYTSVSCCRPESHFNGHIKGDWLSGTNRSRRLPKWVAKIISRAYQDKGRFVDKQSQRGHKSPYRHLQSSWSLRKIRPKQLKGGPREIWWHLYTVKLNQKSSRNQNGNLALYCVRLLATQISEFQSKRTYSSPSQKNKWEKTSEENDI